MKHNHEPASELFLFPASDWCVSQARSFPEETLLITGDAGYPLSIKVNGRRSAPVILVPWSNKERPRRSAAMTSQSGLHDDRYAAPSLPVTVTYGNGGSCW